MCIRPTIINNPIQVPRVTNGMRGQLIEEKFKTVEIKCGKCIECKKQKMNEWKQRIKEEIKSNKKKVWFTTLTYDEPTLAKYKDKEKNKIAVETMRKFWERIRKTTGRSMRHWGVTEQGEKKGRLHIHLLIWTDQPQLIQEKWQYGKVDIQEPRSIDATVSYIVKYITKGDENFRGKMLTSKGIGNSYRGDKNNRWQEKETRTEYTYETGRKSQLCGYYKRKLYNREQRKILWEQAIDSDKAYVMGVETNKENRWKLIERGRQMNHAMGYRDEKTYAEAKQMYNERRERRADTKTNKSGSAWWIHVKDEYGTSIGVLKTEDLENSKKSITFVKTKAETRSLTYSEAAEKMAEINRLLPHLETKIITNLIKVEEHEMD